MLPPKTSTYALITLIVGTCAFAIHHMAMRHLIPEITAPLAPVLSIATVVVISLVAGVLTPILLICHNRWLRQRKLAEEDLLASNKTLEQAVLKAEAFAEDARRAREALKGSEELYRVLVNTLPLGISVMDQEHRIIAINDYLTNWFQKPPAWFVGQRCHEIFKSSEQVCPGCPGLISMQSGRAAQLEKKEIVRGDRRISLRLHTAPIQLSNGTVGFIEIVEDITEHRQMEARTRQMARLAALGEMSSGVAHEINNPINGIINCAELLNDQLPPESRLHDLVHRIDREGNRIAQIVRSLLSVVHPGQAKVESFSLNDCLGHVMPLYENQFKKAAIAVEIKIAGELPPIHGDRQKIEQLLLNLISNAYFALNARFPHGGPDKLLQISAFCREDAGQKKIYLEIYDRGTGIPKEIMDRIFDPFFTTKPAGSGTGLGLGICYEIVKLHGGEIRVESEPTQYSRFTAILPLQGP